MKSILSILVFTVLALTGLAVRSQTCGGEVVQFRETFGNGTARASLPAGRTNYHYNGTGSLTDGDYTLSKSTQAKPEWHISADHTGDLNGRMMVTNASFPPGEFYRDTVTGLSSLSNYTVYFYAMNVNTVGTCSPNPILPQLQLIVESYNSDGSFTQISSMVSNALPQTASPSWVKIAGQIYLPTDVTAIRYRIINNATGGCGNDLAIDDITFSQCDPVILPLTGFALKASADKQSTILRWSTITETNTDKFLVQKSSDNKNWTNMSVAPAAGQSTTYREYSAADEHPFSPVCFYRIASIDLNGRYTYSNTVVVRSASPASGPHASAYPNPFVNLLTIDLPGEQGQTVCLRLFNWNGKMVKSVSRPVAAGANSISLAGVGGLSTGLYYLDVVDRNGAVLYQTKVLKQ